MFAMWYICGHIDDLCAFPMCMQVCIRVPVYVCLCICIYMHVKVHH